ncbi:MAG: PorP/SprF family type IX secretion system membrane protein [Flammeovirgaceae bacterium]|nr:PorP/SprF family type IX secretion system membrane protein [Flammeovirgaceae bacterium]
MKKLNTFTLILFTLILASLSAFGQQDPLYSQYLINPLVINPAYSGLNNNFNVMVGYRTQWTGLDGQPQTFNASAHTSLVNKKVGAGILVTHDQIGNLKTTEANATFAYKLNFEESTFSFGMQAGSSKFCKQLFIAYYFKYRGPGVYRR